MFNRLQRFLLRLLRVPAEPEPPFGAPNSTQVFRASKNYFKLRCLGWGLGQAVVLAGIVLGIAAVAWIEHEAKAIRSAQISSEGQPQPGQESQPSASPAPSRRGQAGRNHRGPLAAAAQAAAKLTPAVFPLLWVLKGVGLLVYAVQVAVSYVALRLDYEMRWYIVTDRSLRIRTGLWRVQELTMSFANLHQVEVSQGPLQRLLGIADVRVKSAGGGGGETPQHGRVDSLHTGFFHGVENATEVRDLILNRLRCFRETGLGDPDEQRSSFATGALLQPGIDFRELEGVLTAANGVLEEVRKLRAALN